MATKTQNAGARLKQQIGATPALYEPVPLNELLCEQDRELNEQNIQPKEIPALQVLAAYLRRQNEVAYGGTLSEAVYFFMGAKMWPDRVRDYQTAAVSMLVALSDNEFNTLFEKKVGWGAKSDLVELLEATIIFMRDLEQSFKPLLLMQEIINTDLTEERLDEIQIEYEARLEMSVSGRYKRA